MTIALKRDGVYREVCARVDTANDDDVVTKYEYEEDCNEQKLKFNAMYTAGTASVPTSMMFWGYFIDRKGVQITRFLALTLFIIGSILFAEADSKEFDTYVIACVFLNAGGAGFFLSHFAFCDHFRQTKYFGLAHSLINCAFDSSTATFFMFEEIHRVGATIKELFYGLACVAFMFMMSTNTYVWGEYLEAPKQAEQEETCLEKQLEGEMREEEEEESANNLENENGNTSLQHKGKDLTSMIFTEQIKTPFFWTVAVWSLGSIFRTMFVLGSIFEQLQFNGNGRTIEDANKLVRLFNALILVSTLLTPFFGYFVDKLGLASAFVLVNALGVVAYIFILWNHEDRNVTLAIAFLCFGCFRAWNYSCLTIYVQGVFGNRTFGKLYGIGIGVFAVISGGMQYPSMHLVLSEDYGNGSFFVVDCLLICIGLALFMFPIWIKRNGVVGAH